MSVDDGSSSRKPKFFCIHVESRRGENVDVRLPFNLIRLGIKVSSLISKDAAFAIHTRGLDLSKLSSLPESDLISILSQGDISVTTKKGDLVRLYCE